MKAKITRKPASKPPLGKRIVANLREFLADVQSGKPIVVYDYSTGKRRKTTLVILNKRRNKNLDAIVNQARKNTLKLTGKETF